MKILITGATGFIGQALVKRCHENQIHVHYLTTSLDKIVKQHNYHGFFWNPGKAEIDNRCFEEVDAIIHLAGASVSKRWTESHKDAILTSRLLSTELLIDSLGSIDHQVKHVISASAIGIYPDSLTNLYDETETRVDASFLGEVVKKWEQAVTGFEALGVLISKVRIGLVLYDNGGALPAMVKPVQLGLGAIFGTGKQWQSWIHLDDLVSLFVYILDFKLPGIFNAVAPNPVTNKEFTKTLATVLDKPLWLPPVPKKLMKLILGDMHIILFSSQHVSSKKIEAKGFIFKYLHLRPALEDLLN